MLKNLFDYRFDLLLLSQLVILFGDLFLPNAVASKYIIPLFFIVNLLASLLLFLGNKKKIILIIVVLFIALTDYGSDIFNNTKTHASNLDYLKLFSFFLFYILLTLELIKQVWKSETINKKAIYGVISGYLSLGIISYFICICIEIKYPGAFYGLNYTIATINNMTQDLLYFSFVSLMTIGYGEIVPVIPLAKKATIFIGLSGQFYLVILTAIIVGKYINQN